MEDASQPSRLTVDRISPVERPTQMPPRAPGFAPMLVQASDLVRASLARLSFGTTGEGVTVAVLDTGLRVTHVDFAGRVPAQKNFTADNDGNVNNAWDGNGHGTNVAGIIVANGPHIGIAPGASVIPIKVLSNSGSGNFTAVQDALKWVLANHARYDITCVSLSLGDSRNYRSDDGFDDELAELIGQLKRKCIAVVVAAGNDFFRHQSMQGMSYPAILRDTISVGAVYDANEGPFTYESGAQAFSTGPDRITPFTQRLHRSASAQTFTNIFAPGAPVTSSGIDSDRGESTQHGTSQATPVATGVVLLLQSFFKSMTGVLPEVDDLVGWLESDAVAIVDGDDENDNVRNTNLTFLRVDCVAALTAAKRHVERRAIGQPTGRAATSQEVIARSEGPARGLLHTGVRPLEAAPARTARAERKMTSSTIDNPRPRVLRPLDDRIPVARPEIYPSRCVGQIVARLRDGRVFQGSGSLLSDYTVLTAGHMVKDANNAFFDITSMVFIPAKNHGGEPYGQFDWEHMRAVRVGGRDWCLISLAQPAGFSVGFLGAYAQLPINRWVGTGALSHIGFPADHRDEMWIDEEGAVTAIDQSVQLRTNIDSAAGQSGGPLVRNWFSAGQVVGSLVEGPNPVEDPNDFMPGWETSKDDTWMEWLTTHFGNRHPDDRFTRPSLRAAAGTDAMETVGMRPIAATNAVFADDKGPDVRRLRPAELAGFMTPKLAAAKV
jgi:V8-like Glu-specific endopeptidase